MIRRDFLKSIGITGTLLTVPALGNWVYSSQEKLFFKISLAEWSLRELLWKKEITNLDFPKFTKDTFQIDAVEYVSIFFNKMEGDESYLKDLKARADDNGVENILIMVDMYSPGGKLASPVSEERQTAVENHKVWVDAAKYLGCHTIRVNAYGYGDASRDEAQKYLADGLSMLIEYSKQQEIGVVIENHGGYSSDGKWLTGVMKMVDDPYCGTLPDFGNFTISKTEKYDTYLGMEELMPFAKGVSAKSVGFGEDGEESNVDFAKILKIVKDAGFSGRVGIEWGGDTKNAGMSPVEGIEATKQLLIKRGKELS